MQLPAFRTVAIPVFPIGLTRPSLGEPVSPQRFDAWEAKPTCLKLPLLVGPADLTSGRAGDGLSQMLPVDAIVHKYRAFVNN